MRKRLLNKKGQSVLEYTIVWTAIVSALLYSANTYLQPAIARVLEMSAERISTAVEDFVNGIGK